MSATAYTQRRALVVFGGQTHVWWLRLLRPGFRHCFVAVEDGAGWLVVDALLHSTVVAQIPEMQEKSLARWYRRNGYTVVPTQQSTPNKRMAPVMPYSCVESAKRILGIHARWVLTPWQLYRHLNKTRTLSLTGVRK